MTQEGGDLLHHSGTRSPQKLQLSRCLSALQCDSQESSWWPPLPLTQLHRPHLRGLGITLVTSDIPSVLHEALSLPSSLPKPQEGLGA